MINHLMISKKSVIHYFLIYLMFISSRACIYAANQMNFVYLILGVCVILSLCKKRLRDTRLYGTFAFVALSLQITRMINGGGLGMLFYLIVISSIWIAYIGVKYDEDAFLKKYIYLVRFFAIISLLGWGGSFVAPDFLKRVLVIETDYFGGCKGGLLYTFRYSTWAKGDIRNTGIFTEPGIYQIPLNSAIFCMLFLREKIYLDNKEYAKTFAILVITLLSTQSTTGYMSFCAIIIGFLLKKKDTENLPFKRKILIAAIALVGILILNYSISGENSILYTALISKLVSSSTNTVDLNVSTGFYRMNGIVACWEIFKQYPLGCGDHYTDLLSYYLLGTTSSGAGLFYVLGVAGIITFILLCNVFVVWAYKNRCNMVSFIVYLFMWINTACSQSEIAYACIVFVAFIDYYYLDNMIDYKFEAERIGNDKVD